MRTNAVEATMSKLDTMIKTASRNVQQAQHHLRTAENNLEQLLRARLPSDVSPKLRWSGKGGKRRAIASARVAVDAANRKLKGAISRLKSLEATAAEAQRAKAELERVQRESDAKLLAPVFTAIARDYTSWCERREAAEAVRAKREEAKRKADAERKAQEDAAWAERDVRQGSVLANANAAQRRSDRSRLGHRTRRANAVAADLELAHSGRILERNVAALQAHFGGQR